MRSAQVEEKEAKKRRDRAALARGEKLAADKNKPYGEDDEGMKGGIIIPLAPFGIPKYDNGERFDLKVCVLMPSQHFPCHQCPSGWCEWAVTLDDEALCLTLVSSCLADMEQLPRRRLTPTRVGSMTTRTHLPGPSRFLAAARRHPAVKTAPGAMAPRDAPKRSRKHRSKLRKRRVGHASHGSGDASMAEMMLTQDALSEMVREGAVSCHGEHTKHGVEILDAVLGRNVLLQRNVARLFTSDAGSHDGAKRHVPQTAPPYRSGV
jgi:hypothetical protein